MPIHDPEEAGFTVTMNFEGHRRRAVLAQAESRSKRPVNGKTVRHRHLASTASAASLAYDACPDIHYCARDRHVLDDNTVWITA